MIRPAPGPDSITPRHWTKLLSVGKEAEYKDLYSDSLEKRMFHFLTVQSRNDTLIAELNTLKPDFKGFDVSAQRILIRERLPKGQRDE